MRRNLSYAILHPTQGIKLSRIETELSKSWKCRWFPKTSCWLSSNTKTMMSLNKEEINITKCCNLKRSIGPWSTKVVRFCKLLSTFQTRCLSSTHRSTEYAISSLWRACHNLRSWNSPSTPGFFTMCRSMKGLCWSRSMISSVLSHSKKIKIKTLIKKPKMG